MATTKIGRIRAAIASLGPDDIEERASLEAALARAEHLASVPPVDRRIADTEAFIVRAKKSIAAESTKIVEAEKQKQIFEQELAQAEKDLIGFRQEAEMQGSGSVAQFDPVSALEAELSRVRAELVQLKGGRTRDRSPIWTQCQTGLPYRGACSDSSHADTTSSRVECMVGRTSFRIARRIDARRHSCSGIEHQVVGRSRAHGRDDRRDAQLSVLRPTWRAVGARYGLRGERIGEASNPGPRLLRSYRRGTRAVDISSDEEPFFRNVVPRLVTTCVEMVHGSQKDLATLVSSTVLMTHSCPLRSVG